LHRSRRQGNRFPGRKPGKTVFFVLAEDYAAGPLFLYQGLTKPGHIWSSAAF
jgi:hypothetical protein